MTSQICYLRSSTKVRLDFNLIHEYYEEFSFTFQEVAGERKIESRLAGKKQTIPFGENHRQHGVDSRKRSPRNRKGEVDNEPHHPSL